MNSVGPRDETPKQRGQGARLALRSCRRGRSPKGPELHEQLQQEAEARDVSVNYLIVKGIKLVLERLTPLSLTERQLDEEAS